MLPKPIAVIDDDDSFREALVESLISLGRQAEGFASGESYLEAARDDAYGCIVSDLQMPGISGLELIARLAARGSAIPVFLTTAGVDAGLAAKAKSSGAACLLIKPFDVEGLVRRIEAKTGCG